MIPSLLQIPSAVSDSKLHSVLPNNGKGDFTFDRSTGATRINKDGLIEEVGYFSSELVQNGNFSELGSELVTNGDFATDSDWTKQTGWSINDGKAISNGSNAYLIQSSIVSSSPNKTFKVTFTVSNYVSGSFNVGVGGYDFYTPSTFANGEYTIYAKAVNASSNNNFYFRGFNLYASIDNVSVKQVDPNDRFELDSASYGQNKVTLTSVGGAMTYIKQTGLNLEANKTYLIKINATKLSGDTNLALGSDGTNNVSGSPIISTSGFKRYYFTPASDIAHIGIKRNFGGSGAVWEITSFSIVEVQGDRPRLSYDITNGVVEDKPHLLLEPSSTNLVTFSEDYTQSVWNKENITVTSNAVISPDGTKNASILTDTSTNGQHRITTSALFSADGNNRVFSVFVKKGTSRYCAINHVAGFTSSVNTVIFDFDTASYVATGTTAYIDEVFTPKHYGNGWYKIAFRSDINSAAYNRLSIGLSNGTSHTDASYAGTGATVFVWGGQVEQQSYCTSYIPTAGTTITRAAETCNNSKPSVNSTEGVLYAEIAALADDSTDRRITISDGTTNNRMCIGFDNASNKIKYFLISSNSSQVNEDVSVSDITQSNKIAFKFKANDFELYMNGSVIASDTSGSTFSANTLDVIKFAGFTGTTQEFYGKVKGLAVYNEALSESQLMQLTGVTASSIYNNFVTRTASFTVEALNEVKKVIDNL